MKHAAWLLICIGLATASQAQEIRKCVADGVVAYQNAPCSDGQVEATVLKLPDYADPPQRDGATVPVLDSSTTAPAPDSSATAASEAVPEPVAPVSQAAFPFRTSIALGMTDDAILNIAGWGRPTRIIRTGRTRGWREVWIYDRADRVDELAFVNGRLASIDAGAAWPSRLASFTLP
jgi:hypothetical protein